MMKNKVVKIIVNIFTVLCLGYVIYKLVTIDIDYKILLNPNVSIAVAIASVLIAVTVYLSGFAYRETLKMLGAQDVNTHEIMDVYVSSNIAKYLPGNVMHFAGRNIIGVKYGLSNKQLLFATFFEVGLKVVVAMAMIAALALEPFLKLIDASDNWYVIPVIIAVTVVVIAALAVVFIKFKDTVTLKALWQKTWIVIIIDAVVYAIYALCFVAILYVLVDFESIKPLVLMLSGVYIISWLVGFITPGAPGGMGVREATLIILLGGLMGEADILLVGIVYRICTIIGDVLSFLMNLAVKRIRKGKTNTAAVQD